MKPYSIVLISTLLISIYSCKNYIEHGFSKTENSTNNKNKKDGLWIKNLDLNYHSTNKSNEQFYYYVFFDENHMVTRGIGDYSFHKIIKTHGKTIEKKLPYALNGIYELYNRRNKKTATFNYKNGELISINTYYKSGEIYSTDDYSKKYEESPHSFYHTAYFKDGRIKRKGFFRNTEGSNLWAIYLE